MKPVFTLRPIKISALAVRLFAVLCLAFALSGCSAAFFGGDLLTSPRLTDEQNEIYNALTASAGRVDLRYPHTGEHRSAFVIKNIDDEPTEEAIVFYEANKSDAAKEPTTNDASAVGNLRVSFLDKDENGSWKAAYELPAAGTEIESVAFSKLGSDKEKILISYTVLGSSDKIMSVIDYENGIATQLGSVGYSSYLLLDSVGSGEYLACFNRDAAKKDANMTVYAVNDKKQFGMAMPMVSFGSAVAEIDGITVGNALILGKKTPCIAIDYLSSENLYGTGVLYYSGNAFVNADTIVRLGTDTLYTRRTNIYTPRLRSRDIDGDDVLDIPVTVTLPGYENLTFPEQLSAVNWFRQDCDEITAVCYTFVDPQKNYILTFPGRWVGMVTATVNATEDTVTFWKYEGDVKESEYALLTIKTELKGDTSQSSFGAEDALRDGFKVFSDDSEKTVYYKSIMYEGLSLTDDEIAASLRVRPEGYED